MSREAVKNWERIQAERDAEAAANSPATRGRGAESPTEIPARGLKDVAWRVYQEISDDRVMLVSAGVTFYLLLALAPLLAALVSIYGLILDPADIAGQAAALSGVMPGGAIDILTEQLERLTEAGESTLGLTFLVSLGLALWSANAGMKSLFDAMNIAYDEREDRGFVALNLVTLAFTVSLIVGIIVLAGFNAAFTTFQSVIGVTLPAMVITGLTIAAALVGFLAFMALLYRYGPSRDHPEWKWITPGAIFAVVAAVAVSALFSYYVANFGSYNETYGSLGAIIGFMTWLWLVIVVLVLGGEIDSELEHQTAYDSTIGHDEPMGQRDAVMADNVGRRFGESD